MRITIFSPSRFHVLDLARELDRLGHDVRFCSAESKRRAAVFGLPPRCCVPLVPWPSFVSTGIQFAMARAGFGSAFERNWTSWLNGKMIRSMQPNDVFIGMSGFSLEACRHVRHTTETPIWIERGSTHFLSQRRILAAIHGREAGPPDDAARRELACYDMAHTVVVPAHHVEESFIEEGFPRERLFRNPYGVDLEMFPPTVRQPGPPTIIMVGAWSFRKGCDILAAAWRGLKGVRLLHVGWIGDAPIPTESGFIHHRFVDQRQLSGFYAQADVLALASREEGLAVVQPQALASGLRLVCTTRTGGEDLQQLVDRPDMITVVPPEDVDALRQALRNALQSSPVQGVRDPFGASRANLSWAAYGARYAAALKSRLPFPNKKLV